MKLVVDCSGSTAGDSIAQVKAALAEIVGLLEPRDSFDLTVFGSSFRHLFPALVPASPANLAAARRFFDSTDADLGGTAMAAALNATFALRGEAQSADVLLITDGEIWQTEPLIDGAGQLANGAGLVYPAAAGAVCGGQRAPVRRVRPAARRRGAARTGLPVRHGTRRRGEARAGRAGMRPGTAAAGGDQSIPGRLDAFGGYSAHEHPYVIRQQPAMKRRPGAPKATLAMAIVSVEPTRVEGRSPARRGVSRSGLSNCGRAVYPRGLVRTLVGREWR